MKYEMEQREIERRIKGLKVQVDMERQAYHLLFKEVSNLVSRGANEGIFDAITRYKAAITRYKMEV